MLIKLFSIPGYHSHNFQDLGNTSEGSGGVIELVPINKQLIFVVPKIERSLLYGQE